MSIYSQPFCHETLIPPPASRSFNVFYQNGKRRKMVFSSGSSRTNSCVWKVGYRRRNHHRRVGFSASDEWVESESFEVRRKRNVVEHILLLKAKSDLSDEQEKAMLDFLYTTQYQMSGVIALSLGRLSNQNPEGYTHAVYIRFQRKDDVAKFYANAFYLGVLKDHVMPHCHGLLSVDYEAEVEDDILPIFRKGEEFNYGVEFMLLVSVIESALGERIDDALVAHSNLASENPSLIVQCTQGSNFNPSNSEYTHATVIRFRSSEAFQMFVGSSEYKDMWTSKFEPIVQKILAVQFPVDPVGTEIM